MLPDDLGDSSLTDALFMIFNGSHGNLWGCSIGSSLAPAVNKQSHSLGDTCCGGGSAVSDAFRKVEWPRSPLSFVAGVCSLLDLPGVQQ
jgi:hypothetical protein